MRLVDADAILKADENSDKALVLGSGKALEIAYALLKKKVEDAPTVDAVVVTRCKDCKHKGWVQEPCHGKSVDYCRVWDCTLRNLESTFCSYGKRKDGNDG
jgi:hypothetical protein